MNDPRSAARLRLAGFSAVFSALYSAVCSAWPGSDGRTAIGLSFINLAFFLAYAIRDRGFFHLLLSAGVFGWVELLADYLCVRSTGTLDYSVARSPLILASPWWMPLAWTVVAVQLGISGATLIQRLGLVRGATLNGLLGAFLIPFYEEMAWGAHWWRYQRCWQISHTPVYIILAEALIGVGLAWWGWRTLQTSSSRAAIGMGIVAGWITLAAGVTGWGVVEFLGRGMRPLATVGFPW